MAAEKLTTKERNLIRRYLIWCYKTTKEELDKTDRYFTQIIADGHILKTLKNGRDYKGKSASAAYRKTVDDYKSYMDAKEAGAVKKKYRDPSRGILTEDYQYLANRFAAIEQTITRFLGARELTAISALYEREMTTRIMQAREHT